MTSNNDRWAPGNTAEGDDYQTAPPGVFFTNHTSYWYASLGNGVILSSWGAQYPASGYCDQRKIIARPHAAPAWIPHYPAKPTESVEEHAHQSTSPPCVTPEVDADALCVELISATKRYCAAVTAHERQEARAAMQKAQARIVEEIES